jgi:hypothetical protein
MGIDAGQGRRLLYEMGGMGDAVCGRCGQGGKTTKKHGDVMAEPRHHSVPSSTATVLLTGIAPKLSMSHNQLLTSRKDCTETSCA